MAKDPAFLFYPGDYLQDTQCLSEGAQVAYDRIMCEHMRNICITQRQLNFFTKRLQIDEKEDLMSVLEKRPGGFCIPWVVESIEKRRAYSESRRKNRKNSPKKTSKSYVKDMKTYDQHMVNGNENGIVNKNEGANAIEVWPTFENFWDLYGVKKDRKKCERLWEKIKQADREKIMDHVPDYKASLSDPKYQRHPSTYLNNENWNDEINLNDAKFSYSQKTGMPSHITKLAAYKSL